MFLSHKVLSTQGGQGGIINQRLSYMTMVYTSFEDVLVNYVVSDSLSSTKHSDDTTLMRFCAFMWRFRAPRSRVVFRWSFLTTNLSYDTLIIRFRFLTVMCVLLRPSQLRRVWLNGGLLLPSSQFGDFANASTGTAVRNCEYVYLDVPTRFVYEQSYDWEKNTKSYPSTNYEKRFFLVITKFVSAGTEFITDYQRGYYDRHVIVWSKTNVFNKKNKTSVKKMFHVTCNIVHVLQKYYHSTW
jgi:hypothetical protein